MSHNAETIRILFEGVDQEKACWKPSPERWSLLEVLNHLADEDRDDFRIRLRLLLEDPKQPWPRTDPPGWVVERAYNERGLNESIEDFLAERRTSIEWLSQLGAVDWSVSTVRGAHVVSAGDLMVSWVAHDFAHIRQLAKLHFEYISSTAAPYSTDYAGAT